MFFKYNRIHIEGDNNLIIQDTDGNTVVEVLSEFIKKFTNEKEQRINLLEKVLFDKEQYEHFNTEKIGELTDEREKLLTQKDLLEKRVFKILQEFSAKDLGTLNERYQQALTFFLDAKLDEALDALNDEILVEEKEKVNLHSSNLIKAKTNLAEMFLLKAEIYQLKFNYEEAEKCYLKMLEVAPWSNYYRKAGLFFELILKPDTAEDYYREGLLRARLDVMKALIHNNLGIMLHRGFNFDEAELHYRSALRLYQKLSLNEPDCCKLIIVIYNHLASLFLDSNEIYKSEEMSLKALSTFEAASETQHSLLIAPIAATYGCLGNCYARKTHYDVAKQHYDKSLSLRRQLIAKDPTKEQASLATILTNLGNMQARLKEFEPAESNLKEALGIYRKLTESNPLKYKRDLALVLGNLGNVLTARHQFDNAECYFIEALTYQELLAKANLSIYKKNLSTTLFNLGNLHIAKNEFIEAEKLLLKSKQILMPLYQENPAAHMPFFSKLLHNQAKIAAKKNELENAEEYYGKSLELYTTLDAKYGHSRDDQLFNVSIDLGSLYVDKHAFAAAEEILAAAFRYAKKRENEGSNAALDRIALSYYKLAQLNRKKNLIQLSEENYQKSLLIYRNLALVQSDIFDEKVSMVLIGLALLRFLIGDYEGSILFNNEAMLTRKRLFLEVRKPYAKSYSRALNNLGIGYALTGNFVSAKKYLAECLWVLSHYGNKDEALYLLDMSELCCDIASLRSAEGEFLKAQRYYEKAIAIQQQYSDDHPAFYEPILAMSLIKLSIFYKEKIINYMRSQKLAKQGVQLLQKYPIQLAEVIEYLPHAKSLIEFWELPKVSDSNY